MSTLSSFFVIKLDKVDITLQFLINGLSYCLLLYLQSLCLNF